MKNNTNEHLPVAVIGAGPVGLAAAARLKDSGQDFILFEAGENVGTNIRTWAHVQVFSPWKYNMDKVCEKLMRAAGVTVPDAEALATGQEIITQYLEPLSQLPNMKKHIHLDTKVISIGRKGVDKMKAAGREDLPFSIHVNEHGHYKTYEAKAVIDASGTWGNKNPIGSGGIPAIGEEEHANHIHHGMPDITGSQQDTFKNKTVLVVGGGHSAVGSILALDKLRVKYPNTKIHWLLRVKDVTSVYGGKEADAFEARGSLGIRIEKLVNAGVIQVHTPVHIHQIESHEGRLIIIGTKNQGVYSISGIDEIVSSTGSRPDFSFLKEVRFDEDSALESVPALADLIDPNIHSCGTVRPHGEAELRQPEKDFYIVGMKSYGRAPTFLMATGYEQVRSIVAYLNGDIEAAKDVQLQLPQTGVCSTASAGDVCCATPSTSHEDVQCCGNAKSKDDNQQVVNCC